MTLLYGAVFLLAACAAAAPGGGAAGNGSSAGGTPPSDARARFFSRVDAALASRDEAALVSLVDWTGWSRRETLDLILPPAPIARAEELNETEVVYRDGDEKTWRLLARPSASGEWRIVPRARPCPVGGMQRRPSKEDAGPVKMPPESWTPLECWPLPK